ncbi:MAG TPA: iron-containing redox enzyme family protein [Thermoanaerobaculia bacterium]|nr:iron-containing redox enzyme family protein [Thermoanaerobaculia bacterium]
MDNRGEDGMFPGRISLRTKPEIKRESVFWRAWQDMMEEECHRHSVWSSRFCGALLNEDSQPALLFALSAVWSVNMVAGSYCFPRYVAALAARAEEDAVRYGLLENAWDESGSFGHTSRSHFWLAVRLARLLGFSDIEIETVRPLPEAVEYTDEHYRCCSESDFAHGLGMICLIEEFTTPEFTMVFRAFLRSCGYGLGMASHDFVLKGGAEYFTANIADDERHRLEMPALVASWLLMRGVDLADPRKVAAGLDPVRRGVKHSVELRARFFEGIYSYVEGGGGIRALASR